MIPFSPPRIDQKVVDEVTAALRSGWITTGPRTKQFEKMISKYCGHAATLCVNSASSGLELMLRWFGVGPGHEVIIPAYTYSATANVVVHCGAKPVMVDIGDDFNIDLRKLRNAISPATRVIMPVDLAGFPCNYEGIMKMVEDEGIKKLFRADTPEQEMLGRILVLSDAAHSLGAFLNGKKTGTLADITVFSFHAVKNLTTAEGGAVCLNLPTPFNNGELYQYLCIKSLHGQTKDALAKSQGGNWEYDVIEAGYKYNMTDIQAAMGTVELQRYDDDMLPRRKAIFDQYNRAFAEKDWALLPPYEDDTRKSSCHVYLLRVKGISEDKRNNIIRKIFEKGVSVNVHFIPLPMLSYYKNLGYDIDHYPSSYHQYSRVISLPVYYDLDNEKAGMVIRAVTAAVEEEL
jgi:dTDP-4-amino-4,6-dideoxygalactose transaminase